MTRLSTLTFLALLALTASAAEVQKAEMAGYLLVSTDKVPDAYNAGFSLYAAAWPLLEHYPGHRFQTGLFGTWMHAQYEGQPPTNLYSDIEGGLGWWRDTRFPTETPKFIMGGVAVNFKESADTVRRMRDAQALPLVWLRDSYGEAARAWGVRSFPTSILVGRKGRALLTVHGEVDWADAAVQRRLAALL